MFRPLTLSIILIAVQALHLAANADTNAEKLPLIAFAQPQSSTFAAYKNALEEETLQVEKENRVIPGVTIYPHNFGADDANRLAKDGVIIGSNSVENYIELVSGNILLSPEKNIVVDTHAGKIFIASGASVFISNSANDVVIYDLLQSKPNQITVMTNKQKLVLEPGRMLALTKQEISDFEKFDVNCHCVAYSSAVPVALNNQQIKAFMANFSITSALTTVQPLQRLTVSNHSQDKLALEKLVKGAVLLGEFIPNADQSVKVASMPKAVESHTADSIQVADASK